MRSRAGFDQVEGAVGDAGVLGGDLLGVADVGLAHLEEAAAAAASSASEASTNSPASELRTTSTPSPPVASRNLSLKSRSREEAMWSSARPSARAAPPTWRGWRWRRPRRRGGWASWIAAMPTPPAPAWIRTFSPGFQAGEVDQAVVGGERRRSAPPRPARRTSPRGSGRAGRARLIGERAEGVGDQAHHPVAGGEVARPRRRPRPPRRRPRRRSAPRRGRGRGRSGRRGS